MLSRPRNPPWKALRPSASLRLTHQVKFSSSLWKTCSRKSVSARPSTSRVDLVDAAGGPGVDRRVDVGEVPLVGRELAVGVHVPLAEQQHELPLGQLGVEQASGMQWKAMSQAANQGYSHLSGHARTSRLYECRQPALRPACARPAAAGRRGRRSASARRCSGRTAWTRAGPASACRCTSRSSSVRPGRLDGGVERVGLGDPLARIVVEVGRSGSSSGPVRRTACGRSTARPGATVARVVRRRLRAPPVRVHRVRRPPTT